MNTPNFKLRAIIAGVALLVLIYWRFSGEEKAIPLTQVAEQTQVQLQSRQPAVALQISQTSQKPKQQSTPRESDKQVCTKLLKPNNDVSSWKAEKLGYIKSVVKEQANLDTQGQVLDRFFVDSGIGLYVGRNMLTGYDPAIRKRPPYHQDEISRASIQAHILVKTSMAAGELPKLMLALNSSPLSDLVYYRGNEGPVFLLSYLLENAKTNADELAKQLVNNGIKVTYSDLVNATKMGLTATTMERLHLASGLDATAVLSHRNRNSSLILIAMVAHNAELAKYWFNMGSPLQPDPLDGNALDVLAEQMSQFHPDVASELFKIIADTGLSPLKKTSIPRLKAFISPEIFDLYQHQMQKSPAILSAEELAQSDALVNSVHTTILNGLTEFELDALPKHGCFDELGKLLTEFLVKGPSRNKKTRSTQSDSKQNEIKIDALIARAASLHSDPDGVVLALGQEQSLANKQAIEKFRNNELAELMKGIKEQLEHVPEADSQSAIIKQIMQLAQQGQWPEVFKLLATLKHKQGHVRSALINMAIVSDTDFSIIKQLLDDGGELLKNVMTPLISKDNVKLAKQLLPYGLDLNDVEMGYSTLARSVQWNALAMLKFLLDNGVAIDSDALGFDSLDVALKQFDHKMTGTLYVSLLISAGAKIELSHKQIVDGLKSRDLDGYSQLISQFPQLKL